MTVDTPVHHAQLSELRFVSDHDEYSLIIDQNEPSEAYGYLYVSGNEKPIALAGVFEFAKPGIWYNRTLSMALDPRQRSEYAQK